MKESKLWPIVEKFTKQHFRCFKTGINKGLQNFGTVDIIGIKRIIKDVGSSNEIIAIEVKTESSKFCKKVGQALGYSIFANRCYLAVYFNGKDKFTDDQKNIANKLGVGLIEIRGKKCKEVLTSPYYQTLESLSLPFIWRLHIVKCQICNIFFDVKNLSRNFTKSVNNDKSYVYWLENLSKELKEDKRTQIYQRRYICSDCIKLFDNGE